MIILLLIVLLLPPTILLVLPVILTVLNFELLNVCIVAITLYSYICLWVVGIRLHRSVSILLSKKLWVGLLFSPFASAGNLYLYFEGALGVFDQVYYYSLAPSLFACFCTWLALRENGERENVSQGRLTIPKKMCLVTSYLFGVVMFGLVFLAMGGVLLVRGYGAVGDLLSPLNLINWAIIFLLSIPMLVLRKVAFSKVGEGVC